MYFCNDADLAVWEPSVFAEAGFGHQALVTAAAATLTGDALMMADAVLGDVLPGMVASVATSDGTAVQLLEIVSVSDASHAQVSVLRGRSADDAELPAISGSVKVTVVSFRPQIAAVGDGLLAAIGVASDRDTEPAKATEDLTGFRSAAIFGTLAAIFRGAASDAAATNVALTKLNLYETLAAGAKRGITGKVDEDGDGVAETRVQAGVGRLVRE